MPPQFGFSPLTHEPSVATKFAAAGTGACLAEVATFPFDMAKVRLMIQGEGQKNISAAKFKYHGLIGTIRTVYKTEGATAVYSGLTAGLHRQLVLGSVRIGLYDTAKAHYGRLIDGHADIHHAGVMTRIASGITTGCASVLIGQPTDVVKVRMQAQGASGVIRYQSALSAYSKIAREEGLAGMWKGGSANAARVAVVNACEIVSYDMIKSMIVRRRWMTDNTPCHFIAALSAAVITIIVSSPVDVLKTRYMNSKPGQYTGLTHCAGNIWKEKGIAAFYKGCIPSFVRLSTWTVLFFISFEQLKRGISHGANSINFARQTLTVEANSDTEHSVNN